MKNNLIPNNAYDDQTHSGRRLKPRGKQRKPFVIEYRLKRKVSFGLAKTLGFCDWTRHSRYTTAARRDQAFAVLVKKEGNGWYVHNLGWLWEYRKKND